MNPTGVGIYLTRAAYKPGVEQRAAKAKAARCRWVALCIAGDDGWEAAPPGIATVAEAYRELGIAVWVWSLDSREHARDPSRVATRLLDALSAAGGAGVALDIEAAYKGTQGVVGRVVSKVVDGLTERHGLGVTSYPIARYHPDLPWAEMGVGWGGPQLYRTAERSDLSAIALEDWKKTHDVVIPHFAAFDVGAPDRGTQAPQLRSHLRLTPPESPAIAIWADAALDDEERAVLAGFAVKRGW